MSIGLSPCWKKIRCDYLPICTYQYGIHAHYCNMYICRPYLLPYDYTLFLMVWFAPYSVRSLANFRCPRLQLRCNGVSPFWSSRNSIVSDRRVARLDVFNTHFVLLIGIAFVIQKDFGDSSVDVSAGGVQGSVVILEWTNFSTSLHNCFALASVSHRGD